MTFFCILKDEKHASFCRSFGQCQACRQIYAEGRTSPNYPLPSTMTEDTSVIFGLYYIWAILDSADWFGG